MQKNKNLVNDAMAHGASILTGPNPTEDADDEKETRMHPLVLKDVTKAHQIYHTESFGPTVSLLTVRNEAEAIAIANDTPYGLSAAVFTEDLRAGLRVARCVDSGAVHVNSMSVHDEPGLEHGGVKSSGWGRFNAQAGIEEFLKMKTVTWRD